MLAQLETPLDGVLRAAERARDLGAVFIIDPAPARSLPRELLVLTDWITPNETEARQLLGPGSEALGPEETARALCAMGPANAMLTLSSKGAVLAPADGDPVHVPAFAVEAVDSTAAGDTFNGAFAAALAENAAPLAAAQFAAAAAAISVTRRGAQSSIPTRAEIEAMGRARG
jgi:ribokinase